MEKIKFKELGLSEDILRAVTDMGFEAATPIQRKAIPMILEGKDIIGKAQTGTGKTAAFGIPLLEKIDVDNKNPQAIILCPTRELAIQVAREIKKLAKYKDGVTALPIYGGQSIGKQIKALKRGAQIIIGTPGRVMDHMRRGTLKLYGIDYMVLDEVDVMLDMGFVDDIKTILKDIPEDRQTLFFSATIPNAIQSLSKKYQQNSSYIKIAHEKVTVPQIEQYYLNLKGKNKYTALTRLLDLHSPELALVFCNTRNMVDQLTSQLMADGYPVDGLHGGLNQHQRDRVMGAFRNGSIKVLVATDVAARGIDVDNIETVFNFDLPQDTDYYVHRIGRTGRAGKSGKAFSFVAGRDRGKLREIQRFTKSKIGQKNIPSLNAIEQAKFQNILEDITDYIQEEDLSKYIKLIESSLDNQYSPTEVAAALLKKSLNGKDQAAEVQEINFGDTGAEPGMVRFFINAGRKDRLNPGHVVGAIAGETGMSGRHIGAIDIYDNFSFVEVPRENGQEVLEIMNNNFIKGNKINMEPAKAK
ncbi:MAG: DEAD/DEAH box helicase [Bacillota bacterium]